MKYIKLGEAAELITKGTTPTTLGFSYQKRGINFVKIESIKENGKFLTEVFEYISEECHNKLKRSQLKENDILFSIAGALGRVALVDKRILPANINQALAIIRICDCSIYIPFVLSALKSEVTLKQITKNKQGVAQLNLSLQNIYDLQIPLPPLEEQKRIATELDKISDLIGKRKKQIEKLDLLVKAKFVEMFGDPVTNPMGWEKNSFSKLGTIGRGVSKHRPRNASELLGGDYPLIQTGDVANANLYIEKYNSSYSETGFKQSKMWKKGTLCITIAANIAKTAILTFDSCFPDSVVGFIPNTSTNSIFMHYWFSFFQKILENQAPESAQKNINLQILSELNIITPDLDLQKQFADYVEKVEETKIKMNLALEQLETLYKARMQEYFE